MKTKSLDAQFAVSFLTEDFQENTDKKTDHQKWKIE